MAGDIQFEEEQQYQRPTNLAEEKSFLVRLVLSTGIVSTDQAAQYVLLGIAATATIIAIALPMIFL